MKTVRSPNSAHTKPTAHPGNHRSGTAKSLVAAIALLLGGHIAPAQAASFDPNIVIKGSAEFDSTGSPFEPINASQSGEITRIMAGIATTTTLNGAAINGVDPLTGTLTSIGDGFGIKFNANGSAGTEPSVVNSLFGDYSLSLQNNSTTDAFLVNLRFEFSQQVDTTDSVKSNTDNGEFAHAQVALHKQDGSELLFASALSDTQFGNQQFLFTNNLVNSASGLGGKLSDSGFLILSFLLNPGELLQLGDGSPEVLLRGAADSGLFSGEVATLLTVDSVVRQRTETVPEPETLLLTGIGLASLLASQRRNRAIA
ncbi:PEP-CTERM sorting domain-containing protein [Methylomonas sp. SURF-1]|uniref:PEP-CTERM sorting domain-containing protein n=1 Tax=Methylomonas aurea TaxID=2952224 RepID=A0ABT1UGM4_9GAMM|nr:PEP-CTERM sorting domain-containing protein [Methylomonas sp. SURF-1]MCQ8181196.1 PEP-CTERM sorting domain-containing protein [Methylomonas sp. SURF-1]